MFCSVDTLSLHEDHDSFPKAPSRYRSLSLSDVGGGFCHLEISIPAISKTDLPELAIRADFALKSGVVPTLSEGAMGGTYFLRDSSGQFICLVFKPADEEPFAPNNPHLVGQSAAGKFNKAYKGNIFPGFGLYRELVAFALDSGHAGVPATQLAKVKHNSFRITEKSHHDYKIGSVQSYVRDIECSAEDMGPGVMNCDDIQRIAVLDIRLCNLDRHPGNLLVCRNKSLVSQDMRPRKVALHTSNIPFAVLHSATDDICLDEGGEMSKSCPAGLGSSYLQSANRYIQFKEDAERESSHSPSPRAVTENGTSPRTSAANIEGGKMRLVPIDHGYCLPHVLHLSETNFAWLYWPQAASPISHELRDYILNLNADNDCNTVRQLVGAAISDSYLLSLRVCTMLLQEGVKAGLTLKGIGLLMTPPPITDDLDPVSPLQTAVYCAIDKVNRRLRSSYGGTSVDADSPVRVRASSISRMKHSPSESSLVDMEITYLSSPTRTLVAKVIDKNIIAPVGALDTMSSITTPMQEVAGCLSELSLTPPPANQGRSICTEFDLHNAMNISNGSELMDALLDCIVTLVTKTSKTVT